MTNETTYLVDQFKLLERISKRLVKIRVFPFGRVVKDGVERLITPELAARFRLPHFRPPLKLGSHREDAKGGGLIVGLEVGEDGLYEIVETNDNGNEAIEERHFGFQSPEVIWEDGYLEHPETGEPIYGPLIVGDALLHTPHLGEAAALYSVEPITDKEGVHMTDTVAVPNSLWEKLMARFDPPEIEQEPAPEPQVPTEDYAAELQQARGEVDTYKAELDALKADNERQVRITHFAAELPDEGEEVHELLAGLDQDRADAIATRLKALYAQIEQNPDQDVGGAGDPDEQGVDPVQALHQSVLAYASEHEVSYPAAFTAVTTTNPDLVASYQGGE